MKIDKHLITLLFTALTFFGMNVAMAQSGVLRPSMLNGNPTQFNGKDVVVRGYVTLEPEGHNIYESKELNVELGNAIDAGGRGFDMNSFDKYCLTIGNPALLYKNRATLEGKTLVIKGKFIDNYLTGHNIDLGACPLPTAIIIDQNDFKQRYGELLPNK
jgi:hypothetical protein